MPFSSGLPGSLAQFAPSSLAVATLASQRSPSSRLKWPEIRPPSSAFCAAERQRRNCKWSSSTLLGADSVQEFSGTQAQDNWTYGYYSDVFNPSGFQEMGNFSPASLPNSWIVDFDEPSPIYWTMIDADGRHPNGIFFEQRPSRTLGGPWKESSVIIKALSTETAASVAVFSEAV